MAIVEDRIVLAIGLFDLVERLRDQETLEAIASHESERAFEEVEPAKRGKLVEHHQDTVAANLAANRRLLDTLAEMARAKGITAAQLALAWVLHQGDFIVPIPGARKLRHLEENAAAASVTLTADDLAAIEQALPPEAVSGSRYTDAALALVDG